MFFRLILIFFLVYFFLRFIQSFFRPKRPTEQSKQGGYYKPNRKEGDTVVDPGNANKNKKIAKNEGEYVDYEDV